MTLKFNRVLEIVKVVHVRTKFIKLSAAVCELSRKQRNRKNSEDAENNTAFASAGSKTRCRSQHSICEIISGLNHISE